MKRRWTLLFVISFLFSVISFAVEGCKTPVGQHGITPPPSTEQEGSPSKASEELEKFRQLFKTQNPGSPL
ncbi:hypothetical protein KA005_26130, partial [bacterium]|nr:hypothetical protein [bacterium]